MVQKYCLGWISLAKETSRSATTLGCRYSHSDTLLKTESLLTDVQMKRDIDLVREILLKLEDGSAQQRQWLNDGSIEGYSNVEVWHHVKIMREAGLVEATRLGICGVIMWIPTDLTWKGHDFLEAARNPSQWERVKQIALEKGVQVSIEMIRQIIS